MGNTPHASPPETLPLGNFLALPGVLFAISFAAQVGMLVDLNAASGLGVITADFTFETVDSNHSRKAENANTRNRFSRGRVQMMESRRAWQIQFDRVANASHLYHYTNGVTTSYTTILEADSAMQGRYGGQPLIAPASSDGGPIGIQIEKDSIPFASSWQANLAWLVWCSGEYLSTTNRLIPDSLSMVRGDRYSMGFRDVTRCNPDWLGAPSSMSQFYDHELLHQSPNHPWMPRKIIPEQNTEVRNPALFVKDGQTRADLKIISSQAVFGASWPMEFDFTGYVPGKNGKTHAVFKIHGTVTSLSTNQLMEFPSDLQSHQSFAVVDHRFRHPTRLVDYITYAQTNFQVQPMDTPKLVELFDQSVQAAPSVPEQQRQSRFMLLIVAAVAVIGTIAASIWWGNR